MVSEIELLQLRASHYLRLAKENGLKKERLLGKGQYRAMKRLYSSGQYEHVIATFRGCRDFISTIGIDDDFLLNGLYEEWAYDGDTLQTTGYLKEGFAHGERYDNSGDRVREKRTFHMGVLHGEYAYYRDDVQVVHRYYENGKLHGPSVERHSCGSIANEARYVDGKPDGICVSYYVSGVIKECGEWLSGERDGVWTTFTKSDVKYREDEWDSGSLIQTRWYKNDCMFKELSYVGGKQHRLRRWDEAGNLIKDEVMR